MTVTCQDCLHFLFLIDKQESGTVLYHFSFLSCNGDRTGSSGHALPLPHISHHKVGVQCVAFAMIGLKADMETSMASSVLIVPLP